MDLPRVSIVLPVYNEGETQLAAAFSELEGQSYRNREIIVVDDGSSTAGTQRSAQALGSGKSDVRVVRTEHMGASHARNTGTKLSTGQIVFFAECDCVYDPDYVLKAVDALDGHPEAGAVCLTGAPLMLKSTLATMSIDLENKIQHRLLSEGKIRPFYAWVYRRDVLLALGGFDENLFQAEDKDLFRRVKDAGYQVLWVPGINWRHKRDQTTSQLARKWFSRGRTRVLYSLKHRLSLEIVKAIFPFWAVIFSAAVLILVSPLVGLLLLLAVFGVFVVYALRAIRLSWSLVPRKRIFLGYPFFIMIRNLSIGIGYSSALVTIVIRKLQGRKVSWSTV